MSLKDNMYIVCYLEKYGGMESYDYLAVKGAKDMTDKELVEAMWYEVDDENEFAEVGGYWVGGYEKLVQVYSVSPISEADLKIINKYITI